MADLKKQIALSADASGVEAGVGKAQKSLRDLGVTAATEGKKAAEGIERVGAGSDKAAASVDRSTRSLINSIQRVTAAQQAGGNANSDYFRSIAGQRGVDTTVLKPYLDQLDAARTKAEQASAALGKNGVELNKYGISAKQTAAAMRGVPAQLTDIIVGLQGGQAPLTVLLQQGGQLKDMFGGVVPAAKALGGALLGLINPYTLAASAVAALGLAYFQGSKEGDALSRAITFSGNAAGVTSSQLRQMAQNIDAIAGTEGAAAAALAQFAESGKVAGANLERFALTAIRMEKTTGQAVSETVKQFAELAKSPVDASVKLNEATNYLTTSLYEQIRALSEQGKNAEAATLAQKGYADALDARLTKTESQLGSLQRAWRGIVSVAKEGWDAMLGIGRANTLQEQITKAEEALDKRRSGVGARSASGQSSIAAEQARIDVLKESLRLEKSVADRQREAAEQIKQRIEWDKKGEALANDKIKKQRELKAVENEAFAAGFRGEQLKEEVAKRTAAIQEKYADKSAGKAALQVDKAELRSDLSAFKSASEQLIGTYVQSERIIESIRAAGLMNDREYYESKRAFINLEAEAKEDALRKEVDRLGQENLTGKDKIDNDRKIAEATVKLAMVRAEASSQLEVLANQEASALKRMEVSFLSARQAAQDYFDTIERQQDRALAGIGQGAQQRNRDAGINQIEDRYASQRRELENQRARLEMEGNFEGVAKQSYDRQLALINEFQTKSIASYLAYYEKLIATQQNWRLGAEEALRDYFDTSRNHFAQAGQFVSNSFQSMEDALANFVKTGKLDFKSLTDSIIADLARIAVKKSVLGPLSNMLMGAFGGANVGTASGFDLSMFYSAKGNAFKNAPALSAYSGTIVDKPTVFPFAKGGSVGVMGEAGQEAILPLRRGTDGKLGVEANGGGGGLQVNVITPPGQQMQATVQERRGEDDQRIVDVVLTMVGDSLANRSGPAARGLEVGYGLG